VNILEQIRRRFSDSYLWEPFPDPIAKDTVTVPVGLNTITGEWEPVEEVPAPVFVNLELLWELTE
jgi:hypothetical protein